MTAITGRAQRASRFSLLLLEDGEVLLSDLAVRYQFIADTSLGSTLHPTITYPERFAVRSANASIRGRVKVGTRNIFFDSEDWRDPVIRIPLVAIEQVRLMADTFASRHSENAFARTGAEDGHGKSSVLVLASKAVFQREFGADHPYVDAQLKGRHVFIPLYTSSLHLLDEIKLLLQITALPSRGKRHEQLRDLVQERESRVPFDITLLEHGAKENATMDSAASAVYALSREPGRFRITAHNVYFMPIHGDSSQAVQRIPTRQIKSVRRLRHGCLDAAIEIGFRDAMRGDQTIERTSLMISFQSFQVREKAVKVLLEVAKGEVNTFNRRELEVALNTWRRGQISNFDYLMYLNMAAGRSFNDLSQYPVFPWVLQDYTCDALDLSKASVFRDLSKPIGALEPNRLAMLQERYNDMPPPRFFYGTHYSTPAYTINYLVRAAPAAMLRLQNGKFDMPDRLFHSVAATWQGVLTNQGDVKELIPEFYALNYSKGDTSGIVSSKSAPGEFLDNLLGLDLGSRQDGKRVDDVELPPWAEGSSELFVKLHRKALECDYVSSKLHGWIDLIFGVKSRNAEALNVFYTDVALPLSIESSDTSKLTAQDIEQMETVYLEFGRTPETLFGYPHPTRFGDAQFADCEEKVDSNIGNEGVESSKPPTLAASSRGISSRLTGLKDEHNVDSLFAKNTEDLGSHVHSSSPDPWGTRSQRRGSVLVGVNNHPLALYERGVIAKGRQERQAVPDPLLSRVVDSSESASGYAEILDICALVSDSEGRDDVLQSKRGDSEMPVLCTIWSDGYLKVHSENRTLRSKYIGDACTIVYAPPGVILYGTPMGSIGMYNIETGRTEILELAAHDAEIHALEFVLECNLLVSGSKDASVKIWEFSRSRHRTAALRFIQELDAESPIDDISGIMETTKISGSLDDGGDVIKQPLVAVTTADGQIMAWVIDPSDGEDGMLEPAWRAECNLPSVIVGSGVKWKRARKVTWLYQGQTRRPVLASIHENENCVRIWCINETKMASAEIFVNDGGAKAITQCTAARTILVGGRDGEISEFDSTGLCLGRVLIGGNEVRDILLPENDVCMYVLTGNNEVWRVAR